MIFLLIAFLVFMAEVVTAMYMGATDSQVAMIALTAGLILVFWVYLLRSTTVPIKKTSQRIKEIIASGNFDQHIDIEAKGEMGDLIVSFNLMGAKISRKTSELEESLNIQTKINNSLMRSTKELEKAKFQLGNYSKNLEKMVKERTKELEVSEQKYRSLTETANHAILSIDQDWRISFFNQAAEKIFGYSKDEILGENISKLIPDEFVKADHKSFQKCLDIITKDSTVKTIDSYGLTLKGKEFPIEISLAINDVGDEIGYVAIIQDITERRALEKELQRKNEELILANQQLAETDQLKSEFLANTSHELRTPLNSITGFLKLILDGLCKNHEEEKEFINNAYESSKTLLGLINDVLDIAKIESGKMALDLEEVDLGNIFNELHILAHVQAKQKCLELNFVPPENDSVRVRADYAKLRQILLNLIGNALKFTSKGSVTIKAEPHIDKGFVTIHVIDTGIGVSTEKQKKLFQKFVQADGSTTRKYGGTGLGLTITRSLVKLMGGVIELKSEGEDKGAQVSFTVPIYTPESVSKKRLEVIHKPDKAESRPLVLIVEDDPNFRSFLEDVLNSEGFATIYSVTADDAVANARKFHPAAITIDFGLLADKHAVLSDGWDIVKVLKEDDATSDARIIIISGHDPSVIENENLTEDFPLPDFIQKPFKPDVLLNRLNDLLPAKD